MAKFIKGQKEKRKKRILAITKKLRLKGRIPHALERPVDPQMLRVKGAVCIIMHWKDQLT